MSDSEEMKIYERKCPKCGRQFRWDEGMPPKHGKQFGEELCPFCDKGLI